MIKIDNTLWVNKLESFHIQKWDHNTWHILCNGLILSEKFDALIHAENWVNKFLRENEE